MRIITIINEKGGSGKTTSSLSYFSGLIHQGKSVAIIDGDHNGHAAAIIGKYAEQYEDCALKDSVVIAPNLDSPDTRNLINGFEGAGFDYVIIDTPPSMGQRMFAALEMAQDQGKDGYVVIPVMASRQDRELSEKVINRVKKFYCGPLYIQPCATRKGERLSRKIEEAFAEDERLFILPPIPRSQPLAQAFDEGLTPYETGSNPLITNAIEQILDALLQQREEA